MRKTLAALVLTIPLTAAFVDAQALSYRQKQAVKNMTWTVNNVEKTVLPKYSDMAWLQAKTWTLPQLNQHINAVNNGFKKLNDAIIHLNKAGCNTGQPEVKALVTRIDSGRDVLRKAAATLQTSAKQAAAAGDAGNYKDYKADSERAKSVADTFIVNDMMVQAEEVREVGLEFGNAAKWVEEREKFYKPFFQQKTPAAQQLERAIHRARSVLTRFRTNAQKFINEAPKATNRELDEAEKYLATAVEKQKPLFLDGGGKQNLDLADQRLGVVEALLAAKMPKWATDLRSRHQKLIAAKAAAATKMEAQILASRRAPQDRYGGADKEQLRKMILDAWKAEHPKDDILGVRLPTTDWQRRKRARWVSRSWEFTDGSWIQLRVAVKTNDERATLYVAYINKNNLTNGVTTNVKTKDGQPHVVQQMLLKNWK